MNKVLIVSPHFPPINGADMHRVRLSLPYFEENGWKPIILTVSPEKNPASREPMFELQMAQTLEIRKANALPTNLCKAIAIGDLGIRAFPWLLMEGSKIIQKFGIDVVLFSTTVFSVMTLGPIWTRKFGVPFVLDMQDPWVSEYPPSHKGFKHDLMRKIHSFLEPLAMNSSKGIIAVSDDYLISLKKRYVNVANHPRLELPFGGDIRDFSLLGQNPQKNIFFSKNPSEVNCVYVGRAGVDMERSLRIIFGAFAHGLSVEPALFGKLKMHFIGTDYATDKRARCTVLPVAAEFGLKDIVNESPSRIPYFTALQLLKDADFLIVPGSDDSSYTASKIFPYILAHKRFLAVFHERSSVIQIIQNSTNLAEVVSFSESLIDEECQEKCYIKMSKLLSENLDSNVGVVDLGKYSAKFTTKVLCGFLDQVLKSQRSIKHVENEST